MKKWHAKRIGECDVHRDIYEEGNPKPIAERVMFDAANALVAAHNGEQVLFMCEKCGGVFELQQHACKARDAQSAPAAEQRKVIGLDLESPMHRVLRLYLNSQMITSDNIGDVRRSLFVYDMSDWNEWVRDLTAERENVALSPAQEKPVEASEPCPNPDLERITATHCRNCGHISEIEPQVAAAIASPSEDTKRLMRLAWEAGAKLAHSYGDNYMHFTGEQKERQWQKFLDAAMSSPSVTQTETESSATPPTLSAQERQSQETDGAKL